MQANPSPLFLSHNSSQVRNNSQFSFFFWAEIHVVSASNLTMGGELFPLLLFISYWWCHQSRDKNCPPKNRKHFQICITWAFWILCTFKMVYIVIFFPLSKFLLSVTQFLTFQSNFHAGLGLVRWLFWVLSCRHSNSAYKNYAYT